MNKETNAYLLIYILSASSNYFFVKDGLSYSDPLTFMSLRYALAGASLAIPLAARHRLDPTIDIDMLLLSLFTAASTGFWASRVGSSWRMARRTTASCSSAQPM